MVQFKNLYFGRSAHIPVPGTHGQVLSIFADAGSLVKAVCKDWSEINIEYINGNYCLLMIEPDVRYITRLLSSKSAHALAKYLRSLDLHQDILIG